MNSPANHPSNDLGCHKAPGTGDQVVKTGSPSFLRANRTAVESFHTAPVCPQYRGCPQKVSSDKTTAASQPGAQAEADIAVS